MTLTYQPTSRFNQQNEKSTPNDINIDFEEISPHQEGVISEIYQRPNKSHFQELPELQSQMDTDKLVQKVLPKQADIDKI